MADKIVNSAQVPAVIRPHSHSALAGNTLYISGQLGLDPQSGEMKAIVEEQARQALIDLGSILKEVEITYDNVVKTTVFLQHMFDFSRINEIHGNYFPEVLLVRSCVEVTRSPKDGLFEVKAVVVRG